MKYRRPNQPTRLSERAKLVCMWVDGRSCRNIARETGKSLSTVCRWIRRWKREGNVNTKSRSGRPCKRRILHDINNTPSSIQLPSTWKYSNYPVYLNMTTTSCILAIIAMLMVRKCVGSTVDEMHVAVDGSFYRKGVVVDRHVYQLGVVKDSLGDQVGEVVGQVVEQHLAGCHLVLVDTTAHSSLFSTMIRYVVGSRQGVIVVKAWRLFFQIQEIRNESGVHNLKRYNRLLEDHLLQGLWGDSTLTCRAIIILLDNNKNSLFFRFLEWCEVWRRPETRVVVVGEESMESVLLHHSLRNTLHSLYLTLHGLAFQKGEGPSLYRRSEKRGEEGEQVWVYGRCLYCNKGEAQVRLLHRGNLTSGLQHGVNLFPEQVDNFLGHTLEVLVMPFLPFIDYEEGQELGTPVAPRDSLNTRMLHTISSHLNFTYFMRQPLDDKWGIPSDDGNWTGIVGALQHHQADFSLDLTLSESRNHVIDHSRVYNYQPYVIMSLKPSLLPRHLALTRPFEEEVWMGVLVSTSVLGIILWLLQKAWSWVSGESGVRLVSSLFYTWEMILLQSLPTLPTNTTGRVLVGWWLLTCVIITTGYRSSLIAHLSVQSKYPPINSFQDLLNRDEWSWGSYELIGTDFLYFNGSSDPDIKEIYNNLEFFSMTDNWVERVLAGWFSFIDLKTGVKIEVAKFSNNKQGNTLFHISTTEYPVFGGNVWGFRQGAPFTRRISKVKQQLIEAGLLNLWLDDIIRKMIKHNNTNQDGKEPPLYTEESSQVVLGLDHLQGAFYLLLLGVHLASGVFLTEVLYHYYHTSTTDFH